MRNSSDGSPQKTRDGEPTPPTTPESTSISAIKTIVLESSFDGAATMISNVSTDEDPREIKASRDAGKTSVPREGSLTKRNILLIVALALILLGAGFGIGWALGERKTDPQLRVNQTSPKPMNGNEVTDPWKALWPSESPKKKQKATNSPTESPTESLSEDPTISWSISPTLEPTLSPTGLPTKPPSGPPTKPPTSSPTRPPTLPPRKPPTEPPTKPPTKPPTMRPTLKPTMRPTLKPTMRLTMPPISNAVTYIPGNLTKMQFGLLLSEGLKTRVIAQTGKPVEYDNGLASDVNFHILPDAGATFPDTRGWNVGGWIYVSNSEARNATEGGVGAITFDKNGLVVDYKMVLENTHMNCGGGRTPWNTWVSCEEVEFTGQIYQVDPTGRRAPQIMTLGSAGGRWESFAYDIRNRQKPRFFVTEDHNKGTTRRFTPNITHWGGDEWKMLHEQGVVDYLYVLPNEERTGGTFQWTTNLRAAKQNAKQFYPQSEGIDIQDGMMYIVCKKIQQLFIFDLDTMTFHNVSTVSGLFDGDPDQMQRILGEESGLLYFTEEGGKDAGIHARDQFGRFFTILESPQFVDETTGLSFSPDGKHLYVAYQENGLLFEVTREDGYPFDAKSLDVKYHNAMSTRRLNSQWIGQ